MASGQRATRVCLLDEDFELDDLWDDPWVEKCEGEAAYYGAEPDFLECALTWKSGKILCPVPLFTPQMTYFLRKASLVNLFNAYSLEALTQREVEAIMIIRSESDKILDEKQEELRRKSENG